MLDLDLFMRSSPGLLWLFCIPLSVWGQATSIIELRESSEPAGTDHTGGIFNFTAVGSGAAGTTPRPWVCYTEPTNKFPTNVEWQTPYGDIVSSFAAVSAPNNKIVARSFRGGLVLSRGTNYFSPCGDYCCVLRMDGTDSDRRCVTFITDTCTQCPNLAQPDNGQVITSHSFVAMYSCHTGYILTPNVSIRVCADGEWTGEQPTCIISCGPSLNITNGTVVSSTGTTFGETATYSCDTGYQLSGSGTVTCQDTGSWSRLPSCELICPDLQEPANTLVIYSDPNIPRAVGSTASYGCSIGYELLSGSVTKTCTVMGWTNIDEGDPRCTIISCGPLSSPANGQVSTTGTVYQSTASYSCDTGYTLSGDQFRTCQDTGQWSGLAPECDIICPDLQEPANTLVIYSDPNIPRAVGSTASYGCSIGYELLSGSVTKTCTVMGWTNIDEGDPRCTIISCGPLSSPANGQVSTTGTVYQSTASYSCDTGYTLSGDQFRTCQDTGQWSGLAPECDIINCGPLSIENGTVMVHASFGTNYMSTATYTCNMGYMLTGSRTRTCGARGLWEPAEPACNLVDCGPLPNPANGAVDTSSGTTYGRMANYSCNTGDNHVLVGANRRMCASDGNWTSSAPTCLLVDCGPLPNPANGTVDTSSGTTYGRMANYSCNTGDNYVLVGANRRMCANDGNWTSSAPTCLLLRVTVTPSGHSPRLGQSFTLDCSLAGGDSLLPTYQWKKGESLLANSSTLYFDSLYLSDAGQYSCVVTLSSSQLDQEYTIIKTRNIEFTSLHFQVRLHLNHVSNCLAFIESETVAKVNDISNRLSQGVDELCSCGFNTSHLSEESINCFKDFTDQLAYGAVIMGTKNMSVVIIASLISEWVSQGGSITVQGTQLELASFCTVDITDRGSQECPQVANDSFTTSPSSTIFRTPLRITDTFMHFGAVTGGVAGALVIAVILLVIVRKFQLRVRRSGSVDFCEESDNQKICHQTQNSPVFVSELPDHIYEEIGNSRNEPVYEMVDIKPLVPTDYQVTTSEAYI